MLPLNQETSDRAGSAWPTWARRGAADALETFTSTPMPDPTEEDWRYVEIPVDLDDLSLPSLAGDPMPEAAATIAGVEPVGRYLAVDGRTVSIEPGDGPASFATLADTLTDPSTLECSVLDSIPASLDRFAAAHRAFVQDGVVVRIPKGKVDGPYLVEFQAVTPGVVSFPHLAIEAEEGAEGSVVVLFRSPNGSDFVVVPQVEAVVGDNANLAITMVQEWGDTTYGVAQQRVRVGRDAHVTLAEAGIGGSNARMHLTVDLEGRGADARILGVYFGDREQTLDYRYFMNHKAPNTTSEMTLKGAVGDTADSVFTGMIRIEPEGQKTNAHQTNRNLVLSEGASAQSVPNLEILANDVRCGHGSAVGPLDEEQRYYLMSRGLDRIRADRLQVLGFFEDVLGRFPDQAVEPPLSAAMLDKYAAVVRREGA